MSRTSARTVDPFAEPTEAVSGGFLTSLTLANIGILISLFTPIQSLLPRYAEVVAGAGGKEAALAWISGAGAVAAIVVNPVAGALSDDSAGADPGWWAGWRSQLPCW
jgi:hypothetical protein